MQPGRDDGMFVRTVNDGYVTTDGAVDALPSAQTLDDSTWGAMISAPAGLIAHDVDNDTLVLNPQTETPSTLVSSVGASVAFLEHQGFVFWTDGAVLGSITAAGAVRPCTLPASTAPTVGTTTGTMPAGDYLVGFEWVDAAGMVSACVSISKYTLAAVGGLSLTLPTAATDATKARVYCSKRNGSQLRLVGDFTLPATPTVTTEPTSEVAMQTLGLSPLPPGAGLTSRGGFLLSWSSDVLWHSRGDFTALCNPQIDYHQFPGTILGAVGVEEGVWVATSVGMYWLGGRDLMTATVFQAKDRRTYAKGGWLMPPQLSGVESIWPAALFISDDGLVWGSSDGRLVAPSELTQKWDVEGKTASVDIWEYDSQKLIVVGGID